MPRYGLFFIIKKTMNNLKVIRSGKRNNNRIALTFDDGPNPYSTEHILEILKFFKIKATFFVLGERCVKYPEILKKIDREGHLVGNHTFSHNKGDFKKCDEKISQIINKDTNYVRPPFYDLNFCSEEYEYLRDKYIITGDVDSKDYLQLKPIDVLVNILSGVKNGSIIDLHDGSEIDSDLKHRAQKTIKVLPRIIQELQSRGFNIVKIDQMELDF